MAESAAARTSRPPDPAYVGGPSDDGRAEVVDCRPADRVDARFRRGVRRDASRTPGPRPKARGTNAPLTGHIATHTISTMTGHWFDTTGPMRVPDRTGCERSGR